MSSFTAKWDKLNTLLYSVQMEKNTENNDFRVFPSSRLFYPDFKKVFPRGNSSWIIDAFSVLERRLSPRVKKQKTEEKEVLNDDKYDEKYDKKSDGKNDEKKDKDTVINTQTEVEKRKEKDNIGDMTEVNVNNDRGDYNQQQNTEIQSQSPQRVSLVQSLSYIKTPLVSFQTAGSWKDKKKSWGKYKKNTGWRDPYRDGEDIYGFHPWRYFAEMFGGKKQQNKNIEKPLHSGLNSPNSVILKNEKSTINTTADDKNVKNVNMNTVMDVDMVLDVYTDILQEGVLGSIKSESGILYIRNTETSPELYAPENESSDKKENPESLVERELYRSIRNYAHPVKPKF